LKIELILHGVDSLKEKRSVVKRTLSRVRSQFEVSAAEVENMDLHRSAVIGIALVTNDRRFANSLLDKIIEYVIELGLAEVGQTKIEIINL
jgi:uncharacterized protein YlxP (DUF503 family)